MTLERFRELRKGASLHKLRALKFRALGEQWNSIVEFRAAARDELEAADEAIDAIGRRGAQVEACGLLFDAMDPAAAGKLWQKLVTEGGAAPPAMLEERAKEEAQRFGRTWAAFKANLPDDTFQRVRLEDVERVLKIFPGIAGFWWAKYRYHERHEEWRDARNALDKALQLTPDNQRFIAMRMLVSTALDDPEFLRKWARETWLHHRDRSAEINQIFALVLLKLTRRSGRDEALPDLSEATERADRLARGTYLQAQASLLRTYVATLHGAPPGPELAPHVQNGRIDERKVIRLCLPNPDREELQRLVA